MVRLWWSSKNQQPMYPYKFNAKELDEDTGLYYYGARYYNPRLSIWYGVDPLTEKMPSWSPYVYCKDAPVTHIDPDGREALRWPPKSYWQDIIKQIVYSRMVLLLS
ncbi:RHS repeat-associated core domain-containing protein [Chryseobacterium sp. NRRL B-14859]|uniref:RHS repeat domain-containing protein n=1 Tax=Chryseobacterium sp. NRRL B-14859 TaxID=1562763 RepID=UPI003397A522